MIRYLVERRLAGEVVDYDVNYTSPEGQTALGLAVRLQDLQYLALLLRDPRLDLNAPHVVLESEQRYAMEKLPTGVPLTPMEIAVALENKDVIQMLKGAGAPPTREQQREFEELQQFWIQRLFWMAADDRVNVLKQIVEKPEDQGGPGVNYRNNAGETALMYAVQAGKVENVRMLLGVQGILVNLRNRQGLTALGIAQNRINQPGMQEIAALLTAAGGQL